MSSLILNIIHLGPGKVGKIFIKQILKKKSILEKEYSIKIKFIGIFNSKKGLFNIGGINESILKKIAVSKNIETYLKNINIRNFFDDVLSCSHFVVIDTSASEDTFDVLKKSLKKGSFAILSNKKSLTVDYSKFKELMNFKKQIFFETTVGAGLPIISTIKELTETGDEILHIQGCLSGTLGFIFDLLQKGEKFSRAVELAKKNCFTEPDPRDDLGGLDVARKALIISRLIGRQINLKDIKTQSLYPNELHGIGVNDFLKKIAIIDSYYHNLIIKARKNNQVLRYIAHVEKHSTTVGIKNVLLKSDMGSLEGPDNIIIIKTKRYFNNPLVIKGPGAGPEVTAAGVFGDLLKIIKMMK
ncbi:MAG: hypothetical protein HYW86_04455 [Candidatus Roizmanbacteria bacterium]|nr:MAG: hypothetical protein HYW86_04455 [Candidatus Roizmanbacteria bacterium]